MSKKTLPQIVNDIYELLEPLDSVEREKIVKSVMTLLGEESAPKAAQKSSPHSEADDNGSKAQRWMKQNGLAQNMIEQVFHQEDERVEIIAGTIPGSGKKGQSQNCYLLSGAKSLLAKDDPKFSDDEAVELCKHMGCYDSKNHSATRKDFGNTIAGSKSSGYTLSAPGLKAAAELVKQMASPS